VTSSSTAKPRKRPSDTIGRAARILRKRYRDFAHHNRKNPLEELLFILCSVQTQESNYRRTFAALRRAFPSFDALASASQKKIAEPLKRGGLSPTKSRWIKTICKRIKAAFGRVTLAPLRQMNDEHCEAFLASLPGVGVKVARCVMMYSLGRQVFPVDTHCWRICRRLGWIRPTCKDGVCSRRDMDRLQEKIPMHLRFSLHVNLISLGRELCLDGNPRCSACPLLKTCPTGLSSGRSRCRGLGASLRCLISAA
jgi:endonuclease III